MKSKRRFEGELIIDHRASPGVSPALLADAGVDAPAVPGGTLYESAIVSCAHCPRDVIMNPQRSRERAWCAQCDRYICDICAAARRAGAAHRSYRQQLDEALTAAINTGKVKLYV